MALQYFLLPLQLTPVDRPSIGGGGEDEKGSAAAVRVGIGEAEEGKEGGGEG